MKKSLCLVLLILLMGISARAENNTDFTFYKDIHFGTRYYDIFMRHNYFSERGSDASGTECLGTHDQTIAGVSGASIYFHMNSDDILTAVVSTVQYVLGEYPRGVAPDMQQYNRIETMLTEKYGRTDYNNISGKKLPCDAVVIRGIFKEPYNYNVYSLTSLTSGRDTVSCPKYSQWVIPVSDGYVIVEHSLFELIEPTNRPIYYEMINYAYLTHDEYKTKIQDETTKMYDDL